METVQEWTDFLFQRPDSGFSMPWSLTQRDSDETSLSNTHLNGKAWSQKTAAMLSH